MDTVITTQQLVKRFGPRTAPAHWAFAERPLANGVDWAGTSLLVLVAGLLVP